MNYFLFEQENDFDDKLSMTIAANSEDEAKELIKGYIFKNTISPKEGYEQGMKSIRSKVEDGRKHWEGLKEKKGKEHPDFFKFMFSDKAYWLTGTERYSIDDFDEDDSLYELFAERDSMRTYLWHYENKPYKLKEFYDKKGIVKVDFITDNKGYNGLT